MSTGGGFAGSDIATVASVLGMSRELSAREAIALRLLERAAAAGLPSPANSDVAFAVGSKSTSHGSELVTRLERKGHIRVERSSGSRVLTILATGKRTAGKITKPRIYGPGSRPPGDPEKRARGMGAKPGSAGHVCNLPFPEDRYVSRDPCPRCNTRLDIGCRHHPAPGSVEVSL